MQVAGGHQLSGAIYPFSMLAGRSMLGELRQRMAHPRPFVEDNVLMIGMAIMRGWLAQFLKPGPLPQIVYSATGEMLCLTTDHFEVQDWPALEAALAVQPDVQGDRDAGWSRLAEGEDAQTRALATLSAQPGGRRISLQTMTSGLADQARPWFEALAGDAVRFLLRELSDPKGLLAKSRPGPGAAPALPEGLDPKALADAIAGVVRRSYANWADEPIPVLGGQTPRQAITTPAGLERVKGLLRSYEDGEAAQSVQQGRSPISYQFLWDALGLIR